MTETAATEPTSATVPHRWLLLGGVWLIYFSFGMVGSSFAPLIDFVRSDLGIGEARMGFILGAWPLGYVFAALPAGILLDRIGSRAGLFIAASVIGLSAFGRAVADTPGEMLAAVLLLGIGGPMISVGAPKLIATLFDGRSRGTAMGIYISGPSLGAVVAVGATNSILMPAFGQDWRAVMACHAAITITSGLAWLVVSRLMPPPVGQTGANRSHPRVFAQLLASASIRTVLLLAVGIFFINHALNNWLPQIMEWHGHAASRAGYLASIPNMVGLLAAVLVPRFVPEASRVSALAALLTCSFVAAVMLQIGSNPVLVCGLVLQGFARGAMMTFAVLILLDLPGMPRDSLGLAGGMFFTTAQIGGVLGPLTFGILLQGTGSFTAPLIALAGLCLALLGLLRVLRREMASGEAAV